MKQVIAWFLVFMILFSSASLLRDPGQQEWENPYIDVTQDMWSYQYITELNKAAIAAGTEEKAAEVETALKDGSLHVFDCASFTVGGKTLTDADSDYIWDGYFHESEKASAPSFDFIIDGITDLTAAK